MCSQYMGSLRVKIVKSGCMRILSVPLLSLIVRSYSKGTLSACSNSAIRASDFERTERPKDVLWAMNLGWLRAEPEGVLRVETCRLLEAVA